MSAILIPLSLSRTAIIALVVALAISFFPELKVYGSKKALRKRHVVMTIVITAPPKYKPLLATSSNIPNPISIRAKNGTRSSQIYIICVLLSQPRWLCLSRPPLSVVSLFGKLPFRYSVRFHLTIRAKNGTRSSQIYIICVLLLILLSEWIIYILF